MASKAAAEEGWLLMAGEGVGTLVPELFAREIALALLSDSTQTRGVGATQRTR